MTNALISFISGKWKQLLLSYVFGTALIFAAFIIMSSFEKPAYRTNFSLHAEKNPVHIMFAIGDLFNLKSNKDSITFSRQLQMNYDQIRRIYTTEYDLLDGGVVRIDITTEDTEIIEIFQDALISYLNSDSTLNSDNNYKRKQIESEIQLINKELKKLNSDANESPALWQYNQSSSELEPLLNSSASLNKIFLQNRLNKLDWEHYNLINVQALNNPIIPLMQEKANKYVYFIFSNIIVLSLLFIQFLIYSSKRPE